MNRKNWRFCGVGENEERPSPHSRAAGVVTVTAEEQAGSSHAAGGRTHALNDDKWPQGQACRAVCTEVTRAGLGLGILEAELSLTKSRF